MRPWPLLLLAASSDARCRCDRRVIVATTVNGVRTASLLVPSAARVGAALVVYHEDSADAAAGLEPTEPRARRDAPACFVEAAGCYAAHDLHVLYPWLAAFADAQDPTEGPATVFGRAYANAVARRGAPRHATHLTAKAHFIFRKVAAIRHAAEAGARDASVDVVAWADADIELVAPLADARFLAFARAHDVATIHRYVVPSRADYPRDGDAAACLAPRDFFAANRSQRALPDTGFLTLALRGGAAAPALAFARAWSGYYATSFAARSRCLNDICVYDRVLFPPAASPRGSPASGSPPRPRPRTRTAASSGGRRRRWPSSRGPTARRSAGSGRRRTGSTGPRGAPSSASTCGGATRASTAAAASSASTRAGPATASRPTLRARAPWSTRTASAPCSSRRTTRKSSPRRSGRTRSASPSSRPAASKTRLFLLRVWRPWVQTLFSRGDGVPSTSRAQVANEDVDRHQLYGRGYYNKVLKDMPEADARADARAVLDDLFLLAACDGFVGKFTSNIDRLALALSNAWRGGDCVTPFESLDAAWCADFGRRTGKSIHGDFMC